MPRGRRNTGITAFRRGGRILAEQHGIFRGILVQHGWPEYWRREPGFAALIQIIIEQQVSLAAARSIYARLTAHVGTVTPRHLLKHDEQSLRSAGLTAQKARYCQALAERVASGELDVDALAALDDETARTLLMQSKGIGRWTADVYLLFALERTDVWPLGDLALARAIQELCNLPDMPTRDAQETLASAWAPWRGCAARLLWQHYLCTPRNGGG